MAQKHEGSSQQRRPIETLSRRRLLATGAAGAAALAGGSALGSIAQAADPQDEFGPSINGTMKEIRNGDVLVLNESHTNLEWPSELPTPQAEVEIKVSENTALLRTGPAKLTDFVVGDSLIAFVAWTGSEFLASAIEPVYVRVEGQVLSQEDSRIETDQGIVRLTEATILRQSGTDSQPFRHGFASQEFEVGSRLTASCRVDPSGADYVAACVGVSAA